MGCDIHLYREVFRNGQWASADPWEFDHDEDDDGKPVMSRTVPYNQRAYTGRNYDLFGVIAGVRREFDFSMPPRGLPLDVTAEVRDVSNQWEGDGHSHSFLFLHELKALNQFLAATKLQISGMKDRKELAVLRTSMESGAPDWHLLYPYCKWSSDSLNYEQFDIEVPASFMVGDCMQKIIDSFDGIEGENHRVVFFFDN